MFVVGALATWMVTAGPAAADPGAGVPLSAVAQQPWVGGTSGGTLGANLADAGDVNGDGVSDVLASQAFPVPGAMVLFTNPAAQSSQTVADLPPSKGYRMRTPGFGTPVPQPVGDQNGDGVPDFAVFDGTDVWVAYGVDDPATDLPKCDPMGTPETRCLDVATPESVSGDRLGFKVVSGDTGDNFGAQGIIAGDFSGDGKQEIAIAANNASGGSAQGAVYQLRNGLGDTCAAGPGLCTVTLSTLPASDVIKYDGPAAGSNFGLAIGNPGDLNEDGKDDLLVSSIAGAQPATIYVIYGADRTASPVAVGTLPADEGFEYTGEPGTLYFTPGKLGDSNGDGRPDVGTMMTNPGAGGLLMTAAFSPSGEPTDPVQMYSPIAGKSYAVAPAGLDRFSNISRVKYLGDLNNDGRDESVVGGSTSTVGGFANAGWAMIMFGQGTDVAATATLGPTFPIERGLAITGTQAQQRVGEGVTGMGDVDDDGIPDFAVSTRDNTGSVHLILGKSLVAGASTGMAGSVSDQGATISGAGAPNGRSSSAHFEWGKSTEYGEETDPETIGKGYGNRQVESDLSGLDPDTTYHYRTVVTNALGLTSYGPDRAFTTGKTPQTPCQIDDTAPGCDKYCEKNPTAPGCKEDPKKVARLSSLIVGQKQIAVKRNKKGKVQVSVVNTGDADATGVSVCLKAPKKLVSVAKGCVNRSTLKPGETATSKFTVKVKKKAKKGKKATLKFTAKATDLGAKTASSKLVVK